MAEMPARAGTWLVTGGSGFLGHHVLRHLSAAGRMVRSLDVRPLELDLPGVEGVEGDVRDADLLGRLCRGVDVVVHAAAVLPSGRDVRANILGAGTVAGAAHACGVRRSVLVSSAVVYGLPRSPVAETTAPQPVEGYGRSKLAAERAWLAQAPSPVVLRPSAFIGPERLGVFGILFRWISEGRRIYVVGDGRNRYQLLAVDDLVAAIALAGGCKWEGVANVGGLLSGTVRDDLEGLIRHAGSRSRIVGLPARPTRAALALLEATALSPLQRWHRLSAAHDLVFECALARDRLGWEASASGLECLISAYDWYVSEGRNRPRGTTHRSQWSERGLSLLRRIS